MFTGDLRLTFFFLAPRAESIFGLIQKTGRKRRVRDGENKRGVLSLFNE